MGASVTSTVRGKIFNAADYEDQPEIVLLGMFTSLVSASFMMMMATYMGKLMHRMSITFLYNKHSP